MEPAAFLARARAILAALSELGEQAIAGARALTDHGRAIDDHQVVSFEVAYAATEVRAAAELLALVDGLEARASAPLTMTAAAGVASLASRVQGRLSLGRDSLGLSGGPGDSLLPTDICRAARECADERVVRAIGRDVLEHDARDRLPFPDTLDQLRKSVRSFSDAEVAPLAQEIHCRDALVPDSLIAQMGQLGYFGLSVPERHGGQEIGHLAMILTTEELSCASLGAAGSLITRPEILARALLVGGTEAQKQHWLPRIASGQSMVAISVTEPDVGSDVASLRCRARRAVVGGVDGWVLDGAKSWCTFAGRADILAVLARTDPDPGQRARGLSLFIVEKEVQRGREFRCRQPGGGVLTGRADATPGYRGMHSFTLDFDGYFVPADRLVGERQGEGRGFYLQMAGFAAGRLQTSGRACGLARAALAHTAGYLQQRNQFGQAIGQFQLSQYRLGRMAIEVLIARALTYAAARAMDEDDSAAATLAAQAKLLSCDMAVQVTQMGQLLHGGWGYSQEYPICRHVLDALVLPIFEGVKPVLALKVIARSLLRA